jgi:SAM-dependent methyltransferase
VNHWHAYDAWEARMNQETRDAVRDGCKQSAAVVLPMIFDTLGTPACLLDVGCGEGWWCQAALNLDVRNAYGVDADTIYGAHWDAEEGAPLPMFMTAQRGEKWDVALCLEMAEHVSPAAGDWLVSELCRVARAVVWSAAIPGQGGDGHVNEQWPDYWTDRFNENGWVMTDPFRDTLWQSPSVEPWYRQNLLAAFPSDSFFAVDAEPIRALVDPVTWAYHRGVPGPGEN